MSLRAKLLVGYLLFIAALVASIVPVTGASNPGG